MRVQKIAQNLNLNKKYSRGEYKFLCTIDAEQKLITYTFKKLLHFYFYFNYIKHSIIY